MEQYLGKLHYYDNNLPLPMFVVGYIDSYGVIEARVVTIEDVSLSHGRELSRGHRWRWCIQEQEYMAPRGNSELTEEELFLVDDFLQKHGYQVGSRS